MVAGEIGINYVEQPYKAQKMSDNRTLICLVAPFKDSSFKLKGYASIKTALKEQETSEEEAVGYNYLKILAELDPKKEIVLVNVTTGEEGAYDYSFDDTKFADILGIMEDARYNILAFTPGLTPTQVVMYKLFWAKKLAKMEGNGAFIPITPTDDGANIVSFAEQFAEGGIYGLITTPIVLENGTTYNLAESTVYMAGVVAGLSEDSKISMKKLDGVTGPITKEVYDKTIYEACINNGAIATKYIDSVTGIVAIANGNTPTGRDLRIERIYHLTMNELREKLETALGKVNSEKITYPQFQGMCVNLEKKYKDDLGYITSLTWNVTKSGSASVDISVKENQDNILKTINVYGELEINEE